MLFLSGTEALSLVLTTSMAAFAQREEETESPRLCLTPLSNIF